MYRFAHLIFTIIFTVIFRWKVTGVGNIPQTGGVIIVANHISLWDPPLLGTAVSRAVHFMAKKELFDIPILGWMIKSINGFPVKRGSGDRSAIRYAINLLENGKVLGLFPEGTRSKTGKLGKPEPGLAFIAAKSGATIIPAALKGSNKVFARGSILPQFVVTYGKPIFVEKGKTDRKTLNGLSKTIMSNIQALLDKQ